MDCTDSVGKMNPLALLLVCLALAAALVVGCGGGEEAGTPTPGTTLTPTASPEGGAAVGPGVTDTEILLGAHGPLSGVLGAVYAAIPQAEQAYFKYINETQGGVCGRKIVLKVEDDQMDPARALQVTRKLVEGDGVLAIVGALGDQAHSAVWDYLNENGVPDLLLSAGSHKWTSDPVGHPWTIPFIPDYTIEGTFLGKYISENLPGAKVGVLYENDDFGKDGLAGVKMSLDPDKNPLVSEQAYETTAVTISSQTANIKNSGAEAVVLYANMGFLVQFLTEAYRLDWHPQLLTSYVNADPTILFQFVRPELVEGLITRQAQKLPDWTDDPAVIRHQEIMQEYGGPIVSSMSIYAQTLAELAVDILSRACDNLTRQGLMDAAESTYEWHSDLMLDGITITITPTDHIAFEQGRFVRVVVVDGKGKFEYFGPITTYEKP
jgi:branched-chain amino acid transport system substrate-binding protein